MSVPRKLGVFWDLENVQIPRGQSARELVEFVRATISTSKKGGRMIEEFTFDAYLDVQKLNEKVVIELQRANVKLIHVAGGDKNGADFRIIQAINDFCRSHADPIIVLISSDENFLPLAGSLKRQPLVTSYLIHAKQVNPALKEAFDESFEWPTLKKAPSSMSKPLASEGKKVEKHPDAVTSKIVEHGRGIMKQHQHQHDSTSSSVSKKRDAKPSANPQSDGQMNLKSGTGASKQGPAKQQLENKVSAPAIFYPAQKFEGNREGYVFQEGSSGIGYYRVPGRSNHDGKQYHAGHIDRDVKPVDRLRNQVKAAATVDNSRHSADAVARLQKFRGRKKNFVCFECNREFASESSLENHQKSTGHSNMFPCGQCDKEFASEQALDSHQKATGHSDMFTCSDCNRKFASEKALKTHQNATGHSDMFPCGQCDREFVSEQALESHQSATGHSEVFSCGYCERRFASEKALENHQSATDHSNTLSCDGCDREFASQYALENHHKLTGHYNVYSCATCGKQFSSEEALESHEEATGHSDMFPCGQCDREFASKQALKSHQNATGHSDVFSCGYCGRSFASEKALENHRDSTGHSITLSCGGCDREFASQPALEGHQRITGHYN